MFDSRWTPGYISDPKLKKYIQQSFDLFEKEYYVRSRQNEGNIEENTIDLTADTLNHEYLSNLNISDLLQKLAAHYRNLKLVFGKHQEINFKCSTELREIFMSILHFSQYSVHDALRMIREHFVLIVSKILNPSSIKALSRASINKRRAYK